MRFVLLTMLVCGLASFALAVPTAPEINPGMAGNALAILAGAGLIVRSRLRK